MSNIDKQTLRRAAMWIRDEKWVHAGKGEVISEEYVANGETLVDHICNCEVVGTSSLRAEFIAAANPSTVLALLDELEAKEEQRANWFQMAEKLGAYLDIAEKRIAELEAREVILPQVQDIHPLGPQSAKVLCEFHQNIVNRCADEIRNAGVKVSINGD